MEYAKVCMARDVRSTKRRRNSMMSTARKEVAANVGLPTDKT